MDNKLVPKKIYIEIFLASSKVYFEVPCYNCGGSRSNNCLWISQNLVVYYAKILVMGMDKYMNNIDLLKNQ